MSYFNYDPFFDNEDEENKKNEQPSYSNNEEGTPKYTISSINDEDNSINDRENTSTHNPASFMTVLDNPTDNKRENPTDFFGEKSEYSQNPTFIDYQPKKKGIGVGLLIAIFLPILIISNVITSVITFNSIWSEAKADYDAKINEIIRKETNITIDSTSLLAYNVAKSQLANTVEFTSRTMNGGKSGSGFIVSADGYIITNAHVVTYTQSIRTGIGPSATIRTQTAVAEEITVNFANSENYFDVKVVAYDSDLDIAVCKMTNPPRNLTYVNIADSTILEYAEPCVAIGNAQGYGLAVTEGIVSSPIQYINLSGKVATTSAIQHSAAINEGNSGGPLFNMYGMVIGMNTFKLIPDSEVGIDGMGFAIPSAVIKDFVNGLNLPDLTISYTYHAEPYSNETNN